MNVTGFFENISRIIKRHPQKSLFLFCFLLNAVPLAKVSTLSISDELGTMANAAFAAGYDWSVFAQSIGLGFYKYGSAILYIPFFIIFKDPILVYRFSLLICAFFVSIIPVFVYKVLTIITEETGVSVKIVISLLVGVLPIYLLWSKQTWSESMLFLIPWIMMYLLLIIYNTDNQKKRIVLGIIVIFLSIYTYMTHSRGIAMIPTVIFFNILIYIKERKWLIHPVLIGIFLVIFGGTDIILGNFFKSNIWVSETLEVNNSINSVTNNLLTDINLMFSFRGIKIFFKILCGWLMGLILSSYGLIIPALILSGKLLADLILKRSALKKQINIVVLFSIIYFIFSLIIGMIFFFPAGDNIFYGDGTERLDKIIYIRYVAGAYGLLIFVSFYDIFVDNREVFNKYSKKIVGLFLGTVGIYCFFISDFLCEGIIALIQLLPFPLFIRATHNGVEQITNFNYHILASILIVSAIFFYIFFIRGKKRLQRSFSVIFIFSISIYIWSMCFVIYPIDNYFKGQLDETRKVLDMVDCNEVCPYIVPCIPRTIYSYQFAFPDYQVIPSEEAIESSNYIIIDNNTNNYHGGDYYLLTGVESNIILKGAELSNYFNSCGIQTEYIY